MRYVFTIVFGLALFLSCKSDKNEDAVSQINKNLSTAEKIANAHGFKNWEKVTSLAFSFQVDKDTTVGKKRDWVWYPKTDRVAYTNGSKKLNYMRGNMEQFAANIDRSFINDKFWLLVPFQLVWDSSATISEVKKGEAPISKTQLNMITITYPKEGGYTPGDAYDIYFDESYMIMEWSFRKGNSQTPSLSTTFENYKDINGIKIATEHKKADGNWNLKLTNINITIN